MADMRLGIFHCFCNIYFSNWLFFVTEIQNIIVLLGQRYAFFFMKVVQCAEVKKAYFNKV